ncbi:hypothetical protein PVK06_032886 [Gossypium arboreum]|uniref:CBS domain-containing protein n=1 Tax=Gossypium arboreum TaxID=29729 RepID=A0ABR0NV35_GOSAR|nr:hypothetical protein PVK06_032886 [Gossypium arboreum]
MFASDMNPARDAGRVTTVGTVLFPIQFTWPHGGRSVFLSGSFNRWTELVPMSQVEGCPNVFQAVYAVPLGCHEYKFFVDGEWRHDERQPHKTGEYGIVNTFDAIPIPAEVPLVHPRSEILNNMEVDNGLMHRVSAVTLNQAMPRISEEDVTASRHRIAVYLQGHTAYELLPESGKVVALDVALPVKQAFHILSEQGIPLAPLWDFRKGKFVGVITASDFILILRELVNNRSNLTEEELETHSIAAWKEGKAYLKGQVDGHGRPIPKELIYASPSENLKDVALKILQSGVAIVPIIHLEDGLFPQLLHLASLAGILKCICRYVKHCPASLPILQLPIYAIPLGTWVPRIGESSSRPFAMLRLTASLSSALDMLVEAHVSSIPIVDDNDSLVDVYCRSDIMALAKGRAYTHNLNEMTVHQALQLGLDSNPPYGTRSQRCQMCLRTDTLLKVMEQLANPGVRRLVIVEAGSNRVEGIISLTDIFRFLLVSFLKNKCGLSSESALTASKYVHFETPEKPNAVIAFFNRHGFTKPQLARLVMRRPMVLTTDVEKTLLPKLEFFLSKGISNPDLAQILSSNPTILSSSLENQLIPSFDLLSNVLESNKKIISALKRHPRLLNYNPNDVLLVNINILVDNGVNECHIASTVCSKPSTLTVSPIKFKSVVQEAKEMGFDPCKGMFMVAIYALGSMAKPTLKRKFEAFKKFTWSNEEISEAFRRYPSFIRLSVDNLMVTMDFLVNKMGCSPSFIAKRPRLLLMSMEKKIVPRFLFGWDLLSKGVIKNINLHALLETSEHLFIEKFVNCYKPEEASRMLKLYHEKLDLSKNLRMDGYKLQHL